MNSALYKVNVSNSMDVEKDYLTIHIFSKVHDYSPKIMFVNALEKLDKLVGFAKKSLTYVDINYSNPCLISAFKKVESSEDSYRKETAMAPDGYYVSIDVYITIDTKAKNITVAPLVEYAIKRGFNVTTYYTLSQKRLEETLTTVRGTLKDKAISIASELSGIDANRLSITDISYHVESGRYADTCGSDLRSGVGEKFGMTCEVDSGFPEYLLDFVDQIMLKTLPKTTVTDFALIEVRQRF